MKQNLFQKPGIKLLFKLKKKSYYYTSTDASKSQTYTSVYET